MKKFFYSTQPIEEPPDPKALVQMMEMLSLTDQVLFSSIGLITISIIRAIV